MVMSLKPVKTKFFRSSHPIPPAPTIKSLASLTLVPNSESKTGFVMFKISNLQQFLGDPCVKSENFGLFTSCFFLSVQILKPARPILSTEAYKNGHKIQILRLLAYFHTKSIIQNTFRYFQSIQLNQIEKF